MQHVDKLANFRLGEQSLHSARVEIRVRRFVKALAHRRVGPLRQIASVRLANPETRVDIREEFQLTADDMAALESGTPRD
jgi:hypothetical protein